MIRITNTNKKNLLSFLILLFLKIICKILYNCKDIFFINVSDKGNLFFIVSRRYIIFIFWKVLINFFINKASRIWFYPLLKKHFNLIKYNKYKSAFYAIFRLRFISLRKSIKTKINKFYVYNCN